jgi:glycosyltransferase involved in cell wall biosynthesis
MAGDGVFNARLATIFADRPMEAQHVLIICHTFPPAPGVGGRRWAKFAKEFARRGHTVHVICAEHDQQKERSPWSSDILSERIKTYPLPRKYPSVLNHWPLQSLLEKLAYRFWLRILPLVSKGNSRDSTVFWSGQINSMAGQLIRAHNIRFVFATGAPFRLLYHAVNLKDHHTGLHVVCDLRDPWTWWDNYGHGLLSKSRFAEEGSFERTVIERSDRIISPSASVLQHLASAYPDQRGKMVRIPHTIDPEELMVVRSRNEDQGYRLIYAGTWYGAEEAERYFSAVIAAFNALNVMAPERFKRTSFDLYIAANDASKAREMTLEAGLQEHIRFHAPLTPKEIAHELVRADAALVFIPSKNKDLMGTKFHELFHLNVPVIHVGEPGAVARTIVEYSMGTSVPVDQLKKELPLIVTGMRRLPDCPTYDTQQYLLEHVTEELLNTAIGR